MLKELFPGSTDFTVAIEVAIFKILQISKHFSAMLLYVISFPAHNSAQNASFLFCCPLEGGGGGGKVLK